MASKLVIYVYSQLPSRLHNARGLTRWLQENPADSTVLKLLEEDYVSGRLDLNETVNVLNAMSSEGEIPGEIPVRLGFPYEYAIISRIMQRTNRDPGRYLRDDTRDAFLYYMSQPGEITPALLSLVMSYIGRFGAQDLIQNDLWALLLAPEVLEGLDDADRLVVLAGLFDSVDVVEQNDDFVDNFLRDVRGSAISGEDIRRTIHDSLDKEINLDRINRAVHFASLFEQAGYSQWGYEAILEFLEDRGEYRDVYRDLSVELSPRRA